ncbi:unnamed protein product [Moneuplotes crassus]|uniref:Uncharacterized protein n=1 Tax=Euplotes crassus TaxID=5936 RepID=A0AAD1Y2T5_EUPCR|nr:unnamed protein product [Moneuplotes crassus]
MVKMKGKYTRYKDKKTSKSKRNKLKEIEGQMQCDAETKAGKMEEEKSMSYGKAKMIYKLKGKRVLEQIRALKAKRKQFSKKDLHQKEQRKEITKEIRELEATWEKEKQEGLSKFEPEETPTEEVEKETTETTKEVKKDD